MRKWIFAGLFLTLIASTSAQAGLFEFEVGTNYRSSTIDKENYQTTLSYLGSISYYFGTQSAIEISYTNGQSKLSVKPSASDPKLIYITNFQFIGIDFVLSLADREASFQPYVKVGGGYIEKEIIRETEDQGSDTIKSPGGIAPSAGVGFKILFTKNFSLKAGVDVWTSPLTNNDDNENDPTIDYSGRLGIVLTL